MTSAPTWAEFDDRPSVDFDPRSPAAELAAVLRRLRHDLDEAGRASAESRAQGLRGLAEQAVLAVELEGLLDARGADLGGGIPEDARRGLRRLKDRMLAQVAGSGLEIVRLQGAYLRDVADLAEVECWSYDEVHSDPVVVQELEAAVRLDGATLRRGRVVVGGRRDACVAGEQRSRSGQRTPAGSVEDGPGVDRPPLPRITCPITSCGAENHAASEVCIGCLTPLAAFARLTLYPAALFNRGLVAARAGESRVARECFAAIVLWHPQDVTTRNAHALACLESRDEPAARRAWEQVIERSPRDSLALRGLAALAGEVGAALDGSSAEPAQS